jgi:hypothetical protein
MVQQPSSSRKPRHELEGTLGLHGWILIPTNTVDRGPRSACHASTEVFDAGYRGDGQVASVPLTVTLVCEHPAKRTFFRAHQSGSFVRNLTSHPCSPLTRTRRFITHHDRASFSTSRVGTSVLATNPSGLEEAESPGPDEGHVSAQLLRKFHPRPPVGICCKFRCHTFH